MSEYIESSKCLASLALFRELYNSQKDIYGILSEFLKDVIITNAKYQFTSNEITQILNNTYEFNIPEAVVKSALKRLDFISKLEGVYNVVQSAFASNSSVLTYKYLEIKNNNDEIINNLFVYIENNKKGQITDEEKIDIVHSFCNYLLNEISPNIYMEYISSFIIQNKNNSNFMKNLNIIREGVILYSGLKYNSNLNDLGSWNTNMIIYLEADILFSLNGYNGELYKILFEDFYSFVNEINKYKKQIELRYFKETRSDIEKFFSKAENIVKGKDKLNPSKTAMSTIVNGCKEPSDVIAKKTKFYQILAAKGIYLDNNNYYTNKNYKFNIEDIRTIDRFKKMTKEGNDMKELEKDEDIKHYLTLLNYINILRKGESNKNFDNIGYIILTNNNTIHKIAWDESIKELESVPLAINLDFITSRLWFKLNKGFGNNNRLKAFDVITKAQCVLSSQINSKVANKYDELQEQFKKGEMNANDAKAIIIELRKQVKKPEEINELEVNDVLHVITESSIEKYKLEQEYLKSNFKKQEEENKLLKLKIREHEEEKGRKEVAYRQQLLQKEKEIGDRDLKLKEIKDVEDGKKEKLKKCRIFWNKILIIINMIIISIDVIQICRYVNWLVVFIVFIIGLLSAVLGVLSYFNIDAKRIKEFWNGQYNTLDLLRKGTASGKK